jgi:hypothetical protein
MSQQQSLADIAVSTLAAIKAMDERVSTEDPERFAIWELKRAAEQAALSGLQLASSIAYSARNVREAIADAKTQTAKLYAAPQGEGA